MKLMIYSKAKTTKDGGRKFRSYWTYMKIVVKGEEEKGKQRKAVSVSFNQGVEHSHIYRGIIDGDFDAPFVYEVKEDPVTGKKRYPTVWVKKINSYTSKESQHQQADFELADEGDTEEVDLFDK